jgi:GDP-4-dehydro-6-deoxy-D-mannose reductase
MRALITGVTGFVGKYLAELLINNGYEVWGTTRNCSPDLPFDQRVNIVTLNLLSEDETLQLINKVEPDHIYHLAGQSNVKRSWENRLETLEANVTCTVNLFEAIRKSKVAGSVKILTVGSSEEYGRVSSDEMPINELTTLQPISPYGISKATVSFLANHYHMAYGLKVVHSRPFNHIGPGQSLGFVVIDFSKQIIDIEQGIKENVLYVGNLDSFRDFTDVRDIVDAYHILLTNERVVFGEVYNVCSQHSVSIQEILNLLLSISRVPVNVQRDEQRMRPSDIPLYIGDNTKIVSLRWKPKIPLIETLEEVLQNLRG